MAALETPWTDPMSADYARQSSSQNDDTVDHRPSHLHNASPNTFAAFSPDQPSASGRRMRSSIIIHQKSPLLMATPPQVTRALAYSHPFILPLNHTLGLLSWTSPDPWESFLVLVSFWFLVLYGDPITRWTGPIVLVATLVVAMYSRRYSPLSSTTWSRYKKGHRRRDSEDMRKTLDEILDTLQTFTARCDLLLDPLIRITEFLSTQSTATSATTRPALTTLFVRIVAFTPFWIALTLPPLHFVTTKRLVLTLGTLVLTWHSRPARVSRTVLWRSRSVRRLCTLVTGLRFDTPPPRTLQTANVAKNAATREEGKADDAGVRFTFAIYENQRRWLGLGWTSSLLAYERQPWTDEQQNTCLDTEHFSLPDTENDTTKWSWVPESQWHVEGGSGKSKAGRRANTDDQGWIYTNTKWQDPSKEDGWGKYTRRRKWIRDAELVEAIPSKLLSPVGNISGERSSIASAIDTDTTSMTTATNQPSNTNPQNPKRRSWLSRSTAKASVSDVDKSDTASVAGTASTSRTTRSRDDPEDDIRSPPSYRSNEYDRRITEGIAEGLS